MGVRLRPVICYIRTSSPDLVSLDEFASNRLATWCAIFALAVQLVSAFGHVHRGTMRPFINAFFAATASQLTTLPAADLTCRKPDLGLDYCGSALSSRWPARWCRPHRPNCRCPGLPAGSSIGQASILSRGRCDVSFLRRAHRRKPDSYRPIARRLCCSVRDY